MPIQPAPYRSRYWNNPQWHRAKLAAKQGPSPSDQWALHRLNRERQLAPGSDVRRALVDELQKEVTFARDTLNNFQERYDKSESLAAKEAWRERGDHFVRGLDPLVKTKLGNLVPLNAYDVLTSKREQFLRQNPPPRRPESDPEKFGGEHARYFLDYQKWNRFYDKQVNGVDNAPMQTSTRINSEFYAVIGDDKTVNLVDVETYNSDRDKIAEGFGTTGAAINALGGRTPGKIAVSSVPDLDGNIVTTTTESYYDLGTRAFVSKTTDTKVAPGKASITPPRIDQDFDPVPALNAAFSGQTLSKKDARPGAYEYSVRARKAWLHFMGGKKTNLEGYKDWLRKAGSDPLKNFTMIYITPEEMTLDTSLTLNWPINYPRTTFEDAGFIKQVPGKVGRIRTKDGKLVEFVMDPVSGMFHDLDGRYVNSLVDSKTFEGTRAKLENKTLKEIENLGND
jgi:hypothetical protein